MENRNGNRLNGPGPVPERWLKCPRKSSDLIMKKFLIFKTPLSEKFNDQVPEQYRFHTGFVFSSMKSYKVKVGLWIDLTNTSRFYDKKEIAQYGCRYEKIHCQGHGETPTVQQSAAFAQLCDSFIRQNPLEVIGVHCTHGFNRSGFLIISYLVTMLDWDLSAALAEFARVRPPGIYKKDYIDELFRRYDDISDAKPAPPMPDWCYEFDGDDSDGEEYDRKRKAESSSGEPDKKRKRRSERVKHNPTFMKGISGVEPVSSPLLEDIQRKVQDLCHWPSAGFPGLQPVSMSMENIRKLSEKPYRVSWKADGVRYLMYIQGKNEIFCIDRNNSVFQVHNLTFPFRKDLHSHMKNTLLDGEMVMDVVNGVNVPRFLVYDIINIVDCQIWQMPFFPSRYKTIELDIIGARNEAIRQGLINKQREPFSVRLKEFMDVKDAGKYLTDKFFRALSHEPDGLIFQPSNDPYKTGPCDDVLKWKPASLNSVDFRLKIAKETGIGIVTRKIGELYVAGMENKYGVLQSVKNILHLDNKIIECTYNNGKWVFMRERTDKSHPNSYSTAEAVYLTIRNPVTKEILLDYIESHRFLEQMPPPTNRPPRYRSNFT